jgi:hypothetical protein
LGISAAEVARLFPCDPSNIAHLERSKHPRAASVSTYRSALAVWRQRKAEELRTLGELALQTSRELTAAGVDGVDG